MFLELFFRRRRNSEAWGAMEGLVYTPATTEVPHYQRASHV